jgi:protein-tyrosine-phosphatase/DNA-binding transcriptional ArsR family regulator
VYAALGDPSRLAIVDALWAGDASVSEICRALDLASNLVAHHVRVLDEAGLIIRVRSEGDRRRTYLRLRPEPLARLATSSLATSRLAARRVVFVCTHNSARSQFAAAIWSGRARTPAASAGTAPAARVHPRAVSVARKHGLVLDPTATAHVDEVVETGDLVVAVCDNAYEDLAAGRRPRLHWSVPDPVPADTDAAFRAAFDDIAGRVERLVPVVDQPPALRPRTP